MIENDYDPMKALVTQHNFLTTQRGRDRDDELKQQVRALRNAEGLCPVCGSKPAYNEALYCGAACAALDGG